MAVRSYNVAETKADLYNRPTGDGELELLLGDLMIGDIVPAYWRYDISSVLSDDFSGGIICPTDNTTNSLAGRWIRLEGAESVEAATISIAYLQSLIDLKFDIPTGDITQYLKGDGTFGTTPTLSDVATSGSYNSLSDTPAIPTTLPPNGSAGGDLSGSYYPNPIISNNAITTAKINDSAITNAKINTVDYSKVTNKPNILNLYSSGGLVGSQLRAYAVTVTPTTASGNSIDISGAGFGTILGVIPSAINNTSTIDNVPLVSLKSVSISSVVVNILSPKTTSVLIGGNVDGMGFIGSLSGVAVTLIVIGY